MEENRLYEGPGESFSLCVWVRERLPDLIEGYLESMVAEAVRAHLAVCYLCAKEYNEMERTIKLVETLPFVEMEKDLTPTIMAALEEQSGYSFQTPVVEVETEAALAGSAARWPRTTTGQQRPALCLHRFDPAPSAVTLRQMAQRNSQVMTALSA